MQKRSGFKKVYLCFFGRKLNSFVFRLSSFVFRLSSFAILSFFCNGCGRIWGGITWYYPPTKITRIIVGGDLTSYNSAPEYSVARLNTDGSLDASFNPVGTGLNARVRALAIDSSGKIIVGGDFTTYNVTSEPSIARLNTDGSLDATFGSTGAGLSSLVKALVIDSSGKVIVAGTFVNYNGTPEHSVARLNTDGSLDVTFNPGAALNSWVNAVAIDSSGKIIVGGDFTDYNVTSEIYIARLNTDGSLDATFNPVGGGLANDVYALTIDSSGKIVVVGDFISYNGTPEPGVARLNTDGSLDATFNPTAGVGLNSWVNALAIDSSGKIIVGGHFTSYNITPEFYVARLNTDGSLDTTFNPTGTGLNGDVYAVALDSSGKIIVSGFFTSYNTTPEFYIARLNTDGSLDTTFNPTGTGLSNGVRGEH